MTNHPKRESRKNLAADDRSARIMAIGIAGLITLTALVLLAKAVFA